MKAKEIGRIPLDGGNSPTLPGLSLADGKDGRVPRLPPDRLAGLAHDMFLAAPAPDTSAGSKSASVDPLDAPYSPSNRKHGLNAKAVLDDKFIVPKGSLSRTSQSRGPLGSYSEMHEDFASGVLAMKAITGSLPKATHPCFSAAAIVHGRPDGTLDWHEPAA